MKDFVEETDYTGVRNAELLARIEEHAEWLRGATAYDLEHIMAPARELAQRAERAEAEAEALRAQLDTAQEAAHMPDDWPHGLSSWINQRLYAAYIGAAFSPDVMEQIRAGRLTFPEAPIYAEAAALRAENALLRGTIAAQDGRNLAATERVGMSPGGCDTPDDLAEEILDLRAERDAARGIETAEQPPEVGQRVQIIITADFVHGGFEPVADNRLFLPRHMAPFWRPLWAGTQRGYEVHVMTGSTSAGRRQRDAGKARRSDEDQL